MLFMYPLMAAPHRRDTYGAGWEGRKGIKKTAQSAVLDYFSVGTFFF
jgi:hypothetical protein